MGVGGGRSASIKEHPPDGVARREDENAEEDLEQRPESEEGPAPHRVGRSVSDVLDGHRLFSEASLLGLSTTNLRQQRFYDAFSWKGPTPLVQGVQ